MQVRRIFLRKGKASREIFKPGGKDKVKFPNFCFPSLKTRKRPVPIAGAVADGVACDPNQPGAKNVADAAKMDTIDDGSATYGHMSPYADLSPIEFGMRNTLKV